MTRPENITARDYIPNRDLARMQARDEAARRRRMAQFLPHLSAHRYIDSAEQVTGVLELRGPAQLDGSSERWVRAIIHTNDGRGLHILVPRITTGVGTRKIVKGEYTAYDVTLDISASYVQWVDESTGHTVSSAKPIVLRRHV